MSRFKKTKLDFSLWNGYFSMRNSTLCGATMQLRKSADSFLNPNDELIICSMDQYPQIAVLNDDVSLQLPNR